MMNGPSRARAYPTRGVVLRITAFRDIIGHEDAVLVHYYGGVISSTFFSGATRTIEAYG